MKFQLSFGLQSRQFIGVLWCLGLLGPGGAVAETKTIPTRPPTLQVWDSRAQSLFNDQVAPVIQAEFSKCKGCTLHNLTNYDDKGQAVPPFTAGVPPQWSTWGTPESFAAQTGVLLINSNYRMSSDLKPWVDFLNQVAEQGTLIVIAAGQPAGGENSAPLSITLAGKVNHALIIGELGERDRLWGASFYGPEMYTAIRPAKDRIGQGGAPAQFAARFVSVLGKQNDWLQYLQTKKQTNRKIWLELSDCFGR